MMTDAGESLQVIVENAPNGLLVVDAQRRVVFANPAAGDLLGVALTRLIGHALPAACTPGRLLHLEHPGAAGRTLELNSRGIVWQGQCATLVGLTDVSRLKTSQKRLRGYVRLDEAISRLADHALQGATPVTLWNMAATLVRDHFAVDFSSIMSYRAQSSSLLLEAGRGWKANLIGSYRVPIDTGAAASKALLGGKPMVVQDWRHEQRFAQDELLCANAIASSLYVPIPRPGRPGNAGPWGVLGAHTASVRAFTPRDVGFMQRMAYVLAYAMQHAQLLSRERENNVLVRVAGRAARIGGWALDPEADQVTWSEETSAIHGLEPVAKVLPLATAGRYTAPEYYDQAKQSMQRLLAEGEPFDKELRVINAQGNPVWVRAIGEPVYDEDCHVVGARGAIQDITDKKRDRDEINFLAWRDPLTELPNRRLFQDRLRQAIAAVATSGERGAVMLLDLDDFKTLNDTRGHVEGDLLLQQVAARLSENLRQGDTVARFSGDEFMLIVVGLSGDCHHAAAQARERGEAILTALREPFALEQGEYFATHSLGITMFGFANDTVDELVKQADLTMYEAKAAGRDRLCLYDPAMQVTLRARAKMEDDMRQGLQVGEFVAWYQGQVDAKGRPIGAEVLARWNHPERGFVSPADFIPLAERSGLIHALGRAMLEQACRQLVAWAGQPAHADLHLAVNVSAHQFHHPGFVAVVTDVLTRSGANPRRLVLELTESSVVRNMEDTRAKMTELRRLGVTFSLDDFGTGYSSLYYLKHLSLSQLKIDQSFVRGVDTDPNDATIVRTVIALAGAMELDVIAEGVETEAERDFLAQHGCQAYQGYLYCRPQPAAEFAAFLDQAEHVPDAAPSRSARAQDR